MNQFLMMLLMFLQLDVLFQYPGTGIDRRKNCFLETIKFDEFVRKAKSMYDESTTVRKAKGTLWNRVLIVLGTAKNRQGQKNFFLGKRKANALLPTVHARTPRTTHHSQ